MREELALTIEDFVVDLIHGTMALGHRIRSALGEVGELAVATLEGAPGDQQSVESEVAELVAPHLALLASKRARMFIVTDQGAAERWFLELHCFMNDKVLPFMGANRGYAERNRAVVAVFVDREIAREQTRKVERSSDEFLPRIARLESGWAL